MNQKRVPLVIVPQNMGAFLRPQKSENQPAKGEPTSQPR